MYNSAAIIFLLWCFILTASGFTNNLSSTIQSQGPALSNRNKYQGAVLNAERHDNSYQVNEPTLYNRRKCFPSIWFGLVSIPIMTTTTTNQGAWAVDDKRTTYLTGKEPKVPGQKPREKNDVSGTKKDPKFLRSISDCKSQCENSTGKDGYARTKEECLSDCQDICCTTYQQCTFPIVNRI